MSRRPRPRTRHEAARSNSRQEGGGGGSAEAQRGIDAQRREFTVEVWTKVERRPGGSRARDREIPACILRPRCWGSSPLPIKGAGGPVKVAWPAEILLTP